MSIVDETHKSMKDAMEHLKSELKNLRTGRANPGILDSVTVEVYGSPMKLRDLANVTVPESRQLLITPYDGQNAAPIAKGIERANLNLQPIQDGNVVRINIPPMDESMRKEIAKQGKKKAEDAKVSIRECRRKGNDSIRKDKSDGNATEDDVKRAEKQIQDLTDKFCKEVDETFSAKEKEIMTV